MFPFINCIKIYQQGYFQKVINGSVFQFYTSLFIVWFWSHYVSLKKGIWEIYKCPYIVVD